MKSPWLYSKSYTAPAPVGSGFGRFVTPFRKGAGKTGPQLKLASILPVAKVMAAFSAMLMASTSVVMPPVAVVDVATLPALLPPPPAVETKEIIDALSIPAMTSATINAKEVAPAFNLWPALGGASALWAATGASFLYVREKEAKNLVKIAKALEEAEAAAAAEAAAIAKAAAEAAAKEKAAAETIAKAKAKAEAAAKAQAEAEAAAKAEAQAIEKELAAEIAAAEARWIEHEETRLAAASIAAADDATIGEDALSGHIPKPSGSAYGEDAAVSSSQMMANEAAKAMAQEAAAELDTELEDQYEELLTEDDEYVTPIGAYPDADLLAQGIVWSDTQDPELFADLLQVLGEEGMKVPDDEGPLAVPSAAAPARKAKAKATRAGEPTAKAKAPKEAKAKAPKKAKAKRATKAKKAKKAKKA